MTIGELARRVGLNASAIRYYERLGLLPVPLRSSGRRSYGRKDVDRLMTLQFARASGFSLDEIDALFNRFAETTPASARWRALAVAKITELDALVAKARSMKKLLNTALDCRCLDLGECGRVFSGRS